MTQHLFHQRERERERPTPSSPRAAIFEENSSSLNFPKRLTSTVTPYNSSVCIVCQKEGGTFRKAETKPKGLKMFNVAKLII